MIPYIAELGLLRKRFETRKGAPETPGPGAGSETAGQDAPDTRKRRDAGWAAPIVKGELIERSSRLLPHRVKVC